MTLFFCAYLLIGFLWMMFAFNHHPSIRELRKIAGDIRSLFVMIPIMLLWPVEVIGLVVYCVVMLYAWILRSIKPAPGECAGDATEVETEFKICCHDCEATHGLVNNATLKADGWHRMVEVGNETCGYWLCPICATRETDESSKVGGGR